MNQLEITHKEIGLMVILLVMCLLALWRLFMSQLDKGLEYKNKCSLCDAQLTISESRDGICQECRNEMEL